QEKTPLAHRHRRAAHADRAETPFTPVRLHRDHARTAHLLALADPPGDRPVGGQRLDLRQYPRERRRPAPGRRAFRDTHIWREHAHADLATLPPVREGEDVETGGPLSSHARAPRIQVDANGGERGRIAESYEGERQTGATKARLGRRRQRIGRQAKG